MESYYSSRPVNLQSDAMPCDLTGLTIGQKTVIRETWRRLSLNDCCHGLNIFLRFFRYYPEHKSQYAFMDTNRDMGLSEVAVTEGIRQHSVRFMAALEGVVKVAVKPASTTWTGEIKKMARIYWALKHTAHDFMALSTTLVDYMEPYFPEGVHDYSRESWTHLLGLLGDCLSEQLREKKIKKEKGCWWKLKFTSKAQRSHSAALACEYDSDQGGTDQWSPKPGSSLQGAHDSSRQSAAPAISEHHSTSSYTDMTAESRLITNFVFDEGVEWKHESLAANDTSFTYVHLVHRNYNAFDETMSSDFFAETRHTSLSSLQCRHLRFTEQRRTPVDSQHLATDRRRISTHSQSSTDESWTSAVVAGRPTTDTDPSEPAMFHVTAGLLFSGSTRRSPLASRSDMFATPAQETSQEITFGEIPARVKVTGSNETSAMVTSALVPTQSCLSSAGPTHKKDNETGNHANGRRTPGAEDVRSTTLTRASSGDLGTSSIRGVLNDFETLKSGPSTNSHVAACKSGTRLPSGQMTEKRDNGETGTRNEGTCGTGNRIGDESGVDGPGTGDEYRTGGGARR